MSLIRIRLSIGMFVIISGLICQAGSIDMTTLDFQKVDPNMVPDELEVLSSTIKANFDKIKTWQGKISFEKLLIYRGTRAVDILKQDAGIESTKVFGKLGRKDVGTTEFKLDLVNNLLFRYRNHPAPHEYIDFDNNLNYPSLVKQFERTIINTAEYEITCYPNTRKKDGTITSRFARKHQSKKFQWFLSGEDPRTIFFITAPPWRLFSQLIENIDLSRQDSNFKSYNVILEKAQVAENIIYRVQLMIPESEQVEDMFILDGAKGFNVTYLKQMDKGETRTEITRDFTKIDGVFLPSKQESIYYDSNGLLGREEKLILSEMQINMNIPKSVFSLTNLGLQEGDDYVDEIENKRYKYKTGGELIENTK